MENVRTKEQEIMKRYNSLYQFKMDYPIPSEDSTDIKNIQTVRWALYHGVRDADLPIGQRIERSRLLARLTIQSKIISLNKGARL
jgi:hypothetical protein